MNPTMTAAMLDLVEAASQAARDLSQAIGAVSMEALGPIATACDSLENALGGIEHEARR